MIGRWLGLSIVVAGYATLSGLFAMAVVNLVSGHVPPEPLVAVGFLAFQAVAVLTLALALGTRLPAIAAGAVTVVLFGLGWFVGVLGSIAVLFDAAPLAGAADAMRVLLPTDGLWRGVIYGLEPPLVLLVAAGRSPEAMAANPFFASAPPPRDVRRLERGLGRARPAGRHRAVPPPRALSRAGHRFRATRTVYLIGRVSNRVLRSGMLPAGRPAL